MNGQLVKKIKMLRTKGHPLAEIAKLVHLTEEVVVQVLNHQHPFCVKQHNERCWFKYPSFGGVYQRCPGCGGKVIMPCFQCQLQRKKEIQRLARRVQQEGGLAS